MSAGNQPPDNRRARPTRGSQDDMERRCGWHRRSLGAETVFLGRPKAKDVDVKQVLGVRRLLTAAGYRPVVDALEAKGKEA